MKSHWTATGAEWINADQQNELSERSEFSSCRRSSVRRRGPADAESGGWQGTGRVSLLTFFCTCNESKAVAGAATPGV